MPLPVEVQTVTVNFGPFKDFLGTVLKGETIFTPSTPVKTSTGVPLVAAPLRVVWDVNGSGSITLPASDSTGLDRTGFTYNVTHRPHGTGVPAPRGGSISLPAAAPVVDLEDLVDTEVSPGLVIAQPAVVSVAGLSGTPTAQEVVTALDVPLRAAFRPLALMTGTSAFAGFVAKADAYMSDLHLLNIGDSTAVWLDQFIPQLAARFPRHNVSLGNWQDGAPGSYAAPVVTTGTGARTIYIWNASVAGKTWQYHFDASRWPTMLAANQHDAVLISLGHNDNPAAVNGGTVFRQRGKALGFIEFLRTICPAARIVLSSQNPLIDQPNSSQHRGDMLRALAQQRGYGYIDVVKAFLDDGRTLAGTLISGDNTHPTAAGYAVWAARVMQEFAPSPTGRVPAQLLPLFGQQGINLLPDPTFSTYTGAALPTGVSLTNCTHARDTTNFETGSGALALTKTAGGSVAFAEASLPLALVKGRTCTVVTRVFVPTSPGNSGSVQAVLRDNTNLPGSETWTQDGQYHWRIVSGQIAPTATLARVRLMVDASNGATLTQCVVDRWGVFLGDLPFDPMIAAGV